jgi:hypothetical protein
MQPVVRPPLRMNIGGIIVFSAVMIFVIKVFIA